MDCEGQRQTSCRNKSDDNDNVIIGLDGWVPDITEEIFDAIYAAVCVYSHSTRLPVS